MKSSVSVTIVHWNTPESLRKILSSLNSDNESIAITVVDNNSDKPVLWVKKEFPKVLLIQNKENFGYAKACNQGAKNAQGEWLVFLNPDITISNSQIKELIDQAENKNLDAFSPETSEAYKKPLPSGLSLLAEFTPLKYLIPLSIFPKKTLTGGALLIKRRTFEKVGKWDERFFLWFEDSDLTKRLYDGGFRVGWVPDRISHTGGESLKKLSEREQKKIFFSSMNIYADKHFGLWEKTVVALLQIRFLPKKVMVI